MREYELTYLVSDDVPETDLKKVTDKVAGMVSGDGGKVAKDESWGRRKLAYPIGRQTFATYITVWFEMEAEKLAALDHELRVYPQVIRHLVTLKVQRGEEITVTKEDIIATKEVERVIGEKSFEVVEGETEASKDLMAVREKEDNDIEEKNQGIKKDNELVKEGEIEDAKPEDKPKRIRKAKAVDGSPKPGTDQPIIKKETVKAKKTGKLAEEQTLEKSEVDEADPSRDGEAEADRIKKLDEKLDELLKDDL